MRQRPFIISRRAGWLTPIAALLASGLVPANAQTPASADRDAGALALRWTALSVEKGQTTASLTLRNTGASALPVSGWSLYFSAISPLEAPRPGEGIEITHIAGPLYQLRVAPGRGPLQPGESLTLSLHHGDIMIMPDKAPIAPYLVYDATPGEGVAIRDYRAEPLAPAAQVPGAPTGIGSMVAPETIYAHNASVQSVAADDLPPFFPAPLASRPLAGAVDMEGGAHVEAPAHLKAEAGFARSLFGGASGKTPLRLSTGPVPGQSSPEAYRLEIRPQSGISITGVSAAGVYYGLQSLRQMLDGASGKALPAFDIIDAPRFGYRGLMIDVARNFRPKEEIFTLIDLMARTKLNRLHFHLTDDEGWRLAIPGLPELTSIGGRRGQSFRDGSTLPPAYGSGPDAGDPQGSGFYTAEEYISILTYAHARHVEVIPEIEMPGHARAAVVAMAERARRLRLAGDAGADYYLLGDPDDRSVYRSEQFYSDNVINPALPSTYRFIAKVVDELASLHRRAGVPLRQMQIGGDELAAGAWEQSPAALQAMNHLPGQDVAALWDHFYDRVMRLLAARDIRPAGWEELGLRKKVAGGKAQVSINRPFLDRHLSLYVWNNLAGSEDLANRLANAGYDVVLAPVTNLYFDMAQARDRAEYGHNWAAYTDLEDVYRLDPFALAAGQEGEPLSPDGRAHITGLEATLFSETVREPWRVGYMLLPRLFGLAERAWATEPAWTHLSGAARDAAYARDWSRFATQVGTRLLPDLDRAFPGLDYRLPPPGLIVRDGQVFANSLPGLALRYSIDGSLPDAHSPLVTGPIADKGVITVAAFSTTGRTGRASRIINP